MFREAVVLGDGERSDARSGEGMQRFVPVVLSGAQTRKRFVLSKPKLTIGGGREADIHLEDEGISRAHAILELQDTRYVITGEGSTNGLFVDGERFTSKTLARGDKIGIGALGRLLRAVPVRRHLPECDRFDPRRRPFDSPRA
ncbi:MAG: FHA domain-containing protein [Candidatus Binatia bacterium]|nr:FHA domain-containing protein [Candidatus Binatia bacterium]